MKYQISATEINLFELSCDQINAMIKKDLINHIENLKGKVTVDATIKKLCDEIPHLLLLYRDMSKDIYLTDHSTIFYTIKNRQEKQTFIFNEYKLKNEIKCATTNY